MFTLYSKFQQHYEFLILRSNLGVDSFESCFFNIFIIENYITDPEHTIGCNATNQISWQSALILQSKWKRKGSAIHSVVFHQTLFLLHLCGKYIILQSEQCTVKYVQVFCIIFAWVLFQANLNWHQQKSYSSKSYARHFKLWMNEV